MDSREIAERTGKQHSHVCRDIQAMLKELGADESKFGSVYPGGNGEPRKHFLLPKRESLILASGYSIPLRAAIIDRWAELEAKQNPIQVLSRIELLRMALESEEKVQALEAQRAIDAPKVAAQTLLEGAGGLFGVREAGKQLGIGQKAFVAMLLSKKIMYRLGGDLVPYQTMIDRGFFQTTTGTAVHGEDVHAWKQAKFTAKGIAWIAEKVAS